MSGPFFVAVKRVLTLKARELTATLSVARPTNLFPWNSRLSPRGEGTAVRQRCFGLQRFMILRQFLDYGLKRGGELSTLRQPICLLASFYFQLSE